MICVQKKSNRESLPIVRAVEFRRAPTRSTFICRLSRLAATPTKPARAERARYGRLGETHPRSDLPVQQATKYDFVINLKTAKTFGITIPSRVIARVVKCFTYYS